MTMSSTTKGLTTTASGLSLGLLLSGSVTMAADTPAVALPTAPPAVETYPHWTLEEHRQHWEQTLQGARDLWAKVHLTPEERQHYWEEMKLSAGDLLTKWGLDPEQRQQYWEELQQGWHDLEAMMSPSAETPPTVAAITAVVPASSPSAALAPAAVYPPKRVHYIWALWGMTPEQRLEYWAYMQQGGKRG